MATRRDLDSAARKLAKVLQQQRLRIVLAESCTGGLISAALTKIPGISEFHCGSAVVYRIGTKRQWLGIPQRLLDDPGPVSRVVAAEMAERVLSKTPEADVAVSITGHLGPDAPKRLDGLIYVGIATRSRGKGPAKSIVKRHRLTGERLSASKPAAGRLRERRQVAAAEFALSQVCVLLQE